MYKYVKHTNVLKGERGLRLKARREESAPKPFENIPKPRLAPFWEEAYALRRCVSRCTRHRTTPLLLLVGLLFSFFCCFYFRFILGLLFSFYCCFYTRFLYSRSLLPDPFFFGFLSLLFFPISFIIEQLYSFLSSLQLL